MAAQHSVWRLVGAVTAVAVLVLVSATLLGVAVPGASTPVVGEESTPNQENPATAGGEQQLGALERQLASELQRQVEAGAINLSRENIDAAQQQLSDSQYEQLLAQYGDVAAETNAVERHQLLQAAQQEQTTYTELLAAYWAQYDDYTAVRTAVLDDSLQVRPGTDQRQRKRARELERINDNLTETADRAVKRFAELDAATETNYSTVIRSITESRDNVTAAQETVRAEQFINTTLSLSATEQIRISPTDPLLIAGRLTTTDGGGLANEPARFEVGEQVFTTTTNETGGFAATYAPTLLPTNTTALTIRYVPENGSVYLGSETRRNVTVEQVTPSLSITTNRTDVRFNSTVAVTGTLTAGGRGLGNVTFGVFLDGQLLAQGETGADGRINDSIQIPATVGLGEQRLTVRLLVDQQALTATNATTSLTVQQSTTNMRIESESDSDGTILVSGTVTANGMAVSAQPLELLIDGTLVGTARTDIYGTFTKRLSVPPDIENGQTARVAVRIDATETNLSPATATATFPVTRANSGSSTLLWLVIPGLIVVILGVAFVLVTRRSRSPTDQRLTADRAEPSDERASQNYTPPSATRAKEFLQANNPAAAVQASYAAARQQLADDDRTPTHWELYRRYSDTLDEDGRAALRQIIESYERATFAPDGIDDATARTAVDAVEQLTSGAVEQRAA